MARNVKVVKNYLILIHGINHGQFIIQGGIEIKQVIIINVAAKNAQIIIKKINYVTNVVVMIIYYILMT